MSPAASGGLRTAPGIETRVEELTEGWELVATDPGQFDAPGQLSDGLGWIPAVVPGTAAAALRAASRWEAGDTRDFDAHDWWFRLRFDALPARAGERVALFFDGIATVADVYLNGRRLAHTESMFAPQRAEVTEIVERTNELFIHCHALAPLLAVPRRPRARWRTRLVSDRNLRFYRTMLLGRAPGFAPGPAAVGPWKPVRLEHQRGIALTSTRVRAKLEGDRGRVRLAAEATLLPGAQLLGAALTLGRAAGLHRAELTVHGDGDDVQIEGEIVVPSPQRWWPHTHGAPALYDANLVLRLAEGEAQIPVGRVGFRSLEAIGELEQDGLKLRLNGAEVFARGAVWTPVDPARPCSSREALEPVLGAVVQAGLNMLRVPGTGCYEGSPFYDLCDELGILIWQDFMFANLDYPDRDPDFMAAVADESRRVLADLGGRPSLAVLCGGSEVAQQAAMLGLDPTLAGGALYEQLLPEAIARADVEVPFLPSTPWGGDLPFRTNRGVANYYGVGAYRRPLEDARRADVRFAAECLAFSNVPDEDGLEGIPVHHPRWKAGVPRDVGAGWDFEDVRDHYLSLLYELDPVALRSSDHERYLDLSRHLTGEVMAEALAEWRRGDSHCSGALVLWLTDVLPGAGWGLLDHRGRPKVAYHYVRRACAPVAVWSTDEGLGGVDVHLANDTGEPVEASLRLSMYRDFELPTDEVVHPVALAPHEGQSFHLEALLGRFVDASWSYRFGPPQHNLIVMTLERETEAPISQALRFPAERPLAAESADRLGLSGTIECTGPETARLIVATRRLAYGVRVHVPGFVAAEDALSIEPGHRRVIDLRRDPAGGAAVARGHLRALNLHGRIPLEPPPEAS